MAALNAPLRRRGYDTKIEITGHGSRAMARIILHEELEQKPEIIEHQLAHSVPDTLGLAYNWTRFIKERSYDAGLGELLGCAGSQWDVIPLARPHAAWSFTAA